MGSPAKAPKAKGGAAKPKKEKKEKDPNAPKRPKSAYFFYLDDIRAEVNKEHPTASIGEKSKVMGEMWNKIKATKEADKYNKKASEDKARYEKEKAKYEGKK
ncbi:hypothetical protein Ndes2526B_g00129 [Nannochloris sp. 'desiccata']|nr:hypothetical protein KSW81_002942 [Chlorella desiccata (nom. nud.)]KAH7624760.1 putative High mobility group protein B1 [Chlorella desiccata (nom. nud.)]